MEAIYYTSTPVRAIFRSYRVGFHISKKVDSIVDRLTAKQIDDPVHYDLRERATQLDLAYRYDRSSR